MGDSLFPEMGRAATVVPRRPVEAREELVRNLDRQNPWWEGKPLPIIPAFNRWPFPKLWQRLEHPIAPIDVVRGPRQIGKTTLQLQLIEVKYCRALDERADTAGLRTFIEKTVNNAPFGLLVTREDTAPVADPRIITVPLPALLIVR